MLNLRQYWVLGAVLIAAGIVLKTSSAMGADSTLGIVLIAAGAFLVIMDLVRKKGGLK